LFHKYLTFWASKKSPLFYSNRLSEYDFIKKKIDHILMNVMYICVFVTSRDDIKNPCLR